MPPPAKVWPPVLQLLLEQPHRFVEHASAYAALAADEGADAWTRLSRRLVLLVALGSCALAAAVLAGVALLLWAMLPPGADRALWPLMAVPAVPLVGALWAWRIQRRDMDMVSFARLREQAGLDAAALRSWGDGDATSR